jgi:hypothetical protein
MSRGRIPQSGNGGAETGAKAKSFELFNGWLSPAKAPDPPLSLQIFVEDAMRRADAVTHLKELLIEHFIGLFTVLRAGGFEKAAGIIQSSLPTGKRTRSGDLGELLAAEYVNSQTSFTVAVAKLQWKSDKETALHGNDIIGLRVTSNRIEVLKGECKSRQQFTPSDAEEALVALRKHRGRPNPASLAFIAKRLYEQSRDDEANVYRDLLTNRDFRPRDLTHLIFVLSGNTPTQQLTDVLSGKHRIQRVGVGVVVDDHGGFVESVFAD